MIYIAYEARELLKEIPEEVGLLFWEHDSFFFRLYHELAAKHPNQPMLCCYMVPSSYMVKIMLLDGLHISLISNGCKCNAGINVKIVHM